jgi:hypothetical protein
MSPVNPLIQKLEQTATAANGFTIISGYLGTCGDAKLHRIYLSLSLQRYVEIDSADIIEAVEGNAKDHPGVPPLTIFYVKGDANVRVHQVSSMRAAELAKADHSDCSCSGGTEDDPAVIRVKNTTPPGNPDALCFARAWNAEYNCLDALSQHPEVTHSSEICANLRQRIYNMCRGRGMASVSTEIG